MNLYDLTLEYTDLQNMLEDPNEDPEEIAGKLAAISDQLEVKADNYAKVIRNLEAQVPGIKSEVDRLASRKTAIENGIKRLKENLQQAMITTEKTKFKTDLFTFAIQKNGGAQPVVVDVEVDALPDELCKITRNPDKEAITKYINETGDLTYAHFGDRGESLRIR